MSIQTPWNSQFNNAKGSLLVGNATRPIVRTVGTNGQVLTANSANADGVAWTNVTGGVNTASITLTSLQIKSLHVTPILMIPAQGANKWIAIYSCVARMAYGGSNVFVSGSNIELDYGPVSGAISVHGAVTAATISAAVSTSCVPNGTYGSFGNKPDLNLYNVAIFVNNPGAAITGNGSNNNTITIKCLYYVYTMP